MKKYLLCLIVAVTLSNCNISTQSSKADAPSTTHLFNARYSEVIYKTVTIDSMDFAVFLYNDIRVSPFVINLTKDKLEIAKLNKELGYSQ